MTDIGLTDEAEAVGRGWWWLLLVTGILWILLGIFVLEAHYQSAVLIGVLVGVWLLFAGVTEFMALGIVAGWKWVHATLGVLFVIGGVAALLSPFQTFTVLAGLIGFFLILFGAFECTFAIVGRHALELWWLNLITGVLMIALGVWAAGYPGRSAVLLLAWVGIGAIIRGVVDLVRAFHLRAGAEVVMAT
jgi:uncharacterized membrane protein HdeD (DUF308 family)